MSNIGLIPVSAAASSGNIKNIGTRGYYLCTATEALQTDMDPENRLFLGIDLGGTTISVGVISDTGKVISEASKWITDRTVNGVLNLMVELCKEAVKSCPKAGVTMMSVSVYRLS
jgi:activator of 2-hydroxyglutaryl-CoA dehydratase